MQGKYWVRNQGGRLESNSSSSSRLRRPLFSEGPSFVSPPLNQEPSDNLPRLQYINPVFGSPSSSTSSAHSLTPHPSTSPTRSLPSSPFLEDPPRIPLIRQQALSSPSTSSPSVHMADEVENNQNQNNDIKDLLHHLVSGQAQMREDFQQMFQHLLTRDNKPEGSNHEGPVGGNEENTTPISDFEKRMDKRMEQMEKVIKKARRYDEAVDLQSLSLYPEARLPAKFKMPSFDKFDSTSCPVSHLKMYVRAMQPLGADDAILAQMFQSSLTGSALKWFMKLGEAHTRTWEDICAEFTRYFNYNNEVDVTRRDLETTKQDPKETFSSFITRWRAKAAHMPDRPNEEEQLQIVVKNLLPVYNKHLFAQYLPNFKALVKAGTQIEDAIELGTVKVEDFQRAKKFTPIGSSSKVQEIAVISKPNPIQLSFPKAPRQYNDLYMPPSKVFEKLIENDLLRPLDPTPLPARLPRTFDMAQRCDYHQGPGHSTDRCYALKNAIQDLIDNEIISPPTPPNRPNVNHNPLPNHHNQRPRINCIEDQEMGDPSLLIHKIPSCNMLSWDELMEDVPAKPKIDIWKDGKATKASTQTLASQASSSRPMPYKATPYKYQAQHYNPQKIQDQPYNPQRTQSQFYNPQKATQGQFFTPQKATQAQSFKHSSFYQKATQPPITRQSPINQKAPQALNSKHLFTSQASSSTNEPKQSPPSQKAIQAPSPLKPTNTEAESPNTFLNQTQNSPEITHITRGGRHFKPPHLEADNPLEALSQQAPQPTLEDDLVLKQLQKTQANISLWSLLMASYSHRQAILKLLNQVQIPTDISPEALSAMIGTISQDTVIAFSDKDLPINGTNHNEALNITVDIGENRVPMVLIDNGSALNVCTLKTTIYLGINHSEFLPSNQFVRAYDDTKREVHGVVVLNISIGPMVQKVHFQVMDITASFNMLLGRPWLHETKAISSSLHQKVRFPYKGSIVTVHGDTQIIPSKGPVLEIEPVDGDLVLSGFDFEEVHTLVLATETPEFFPIYYDPYSNDKVVTMIRGMGYFPGMGLGRKDQGIAEFQDYPKAIPTFGLGYKPTEEELLQKKERFLARIEAQNKGLPFDPIPMKPYTLTLNGKFVKEGEEHPYHGFPEPWKNKSTNQNMPGFEIFFNNQLDIEDLMQGIEKIEVKDWAEEMDGIAMEELLDGTVHMLGKKTDKDPSLLIGPTKDPLTNWVWGNGFANGDYKEEAKSAEFGPSLEFESVSKFNVKLFPVFDSESVSNDSESSSNNSSINGITDDSAYILSLNVLISQLMNNVIANNNEETPPTEERLVKPIKEEIETVNIGTNDEPKMMQIGKNLTPFEKDEFIALLREFQEVFAWSYEDMPGIDTDIVQHSIPTDPTFRPVKQKLRRMKPEWTLKIKEEVEKQYNAGFLKVVNYPEWLANVVPVPKKDGKVRMCVDFRDLNKASPKDDFPLPHIDVLVDNTAGHAMLSFMDGFSGYNQIKMAPEDMEKTSFITPWGTYCYKVMPFGLKNAGATYQRAATTLLHDMIHKEVEVYVDDMIVKSKERQGHTTSLRKFFERIRHYKLRLNPKKCMFGVTSGKLLGFIVSQRGIEVDPDKIKAILEMKEPRTEKEIRGFLGRIQYISRFIAQLTTICEPMFKLLKKDVPVKWNNQCQVAFDRIKNYLLNPPILMPPLQDKPLLLYLSTTDTAMEALLAQYIEESRKENAIYYLSKKMTEGETKYSTLEKTCVALVWATQKLRHYLLSFPVLLLARLDPLKYLLEKPIQDGKTAKWIILLTEFDITYVTQKSIKGRAIAEHLAQCPSEEAKAIDFEFPDENILVIQSVMWKMYFDGASNRHGSGIGILLVSPTDSHIPISIKLQFSTTNNMAEYEACILGLEAAISLGIKVLEVYGDSALIIRQAQKKWKVKEEKLQPYLEKLDMLTEQFDNLEFQYIPRNQNQFADALATLASMIDIPSGVNLKPLMIEQREQPAYCCTLETFTEEENVWYHDIHQYLKDGSYPLTTSKVEKQTIRRLAMQYILCGEKLYRRSYEGVHLLCVTKREGEQIIEDIHEGAYGPHMNAHILSRKILRLGYYWTTMEADCAAHVRRCHKCQIHGNLKHMPPMPLYSMSSPWPFATWGIDIIGKIVPKASNGHEFILVAIDYFTKWVEAASFKILNSRKVAQFIRTNIICRYGVPHEIISDNGSHFRDETKKLLHEYKIKHHKSSPYRPQTNGAVEAANKNVEMILRKNAERHRNWHEKLPYALWGYRTSIRTATGATPYSLVYGMEAVLPIELEIQSLRVVMEEKIPETEWLQERYNQLNMMEEKRLRALYNTQGYQRRAMRAFNKKVKPRNIKIGDMVLKEIRAPVHDPRGKFKPNWSGPFIVKEIYSGGAARLIDIDGNPFTEPTNLDQLKKYFV